MAQRVKTKKLTPAEKARVSAAFSEVKRDEPAIVAATRRKKGPAAAARQKTAIALSKADLPKKRRDNPGHTRRKSMLRGSPFAAVVLSILSSFFMSCAYVDKSINIHGVDSESTIVVDYDTKSQQDLEDLLDLDIVPPIP